jgi:hypothetical protein
MHRQVAALIAAGGSPGRLARFGSALGDKRIDIATTGGAEWKHNAPMTLILKEDDHDQIDGFAGVMEKEKFPWLVFRTIEVELKDEPGAIGAAARAFGNINIYAVTILESDGANALVGFAVRPNEVGAAITQLRAADYTSARRRRHPGDTDDPNDADDVSWRDAWDDRTEKLLPDFEKPNVRPDDPKFYKPKP